MPRHSAGLLLYRERAGIEVLLGHMGGPFWARKDEAAWSIPKGELEQGEDVETAARREFSEELGLPPPEGEYHALGEVRQSAKIITAFAVRAEIDPAHIVAGTFDLEWPPRSGTVQQFPELDRVCWFSMEGAERKLVKGQRPFLDRLARLLTD